MHSNLLPKIYQETIKFPSDQNIYDPSIPFGGVLPHKFEELCAVKGEILEISLLSQENQDKLAALTLPDLYEAMYFDAYAIVRFVQRPDLPDELSDPNGIKIKLCVYNCGFYHSCYRKFYKDNIGRYVLDEDGKPILIPKEPLINGIWDLPWLAFSTHELVIVLYDKVASSGIPLDQRLIIVCHSTYDGIDGPDNGSDPILKAINCSTVSYNNLVTDDYVYYKFVDNNGFILNIESFDKTINNFICGKDKDIVDYSKNRCVNVSYAPLVYLRSSTINNYVYLELNYTGIAGEFLSGINTEFNDKVFTPAFPIESLGWGITWHFSPFYTHYVDDARLSVILSIPDYGDSVFFISGCILNSDGSIDPNTISSEVITAASAGFDISYCAYETISTQSTLIDCINSTQYESTHDINIKHSSHHLIDADLVSGNSFESNCNSLDCSFNENGYLNHACSGDVFDHYLECSYSEKQELIVKYNGNKRTICSNVITGSRERSASCDGTDISRSKVESESGNLHVLVEMDIVQGIFIFIDLTYTSNKNSLSSGTLTNGVYPYTKDKTLTANITGELKIYCAENDSWTTIEQGSGNINISNSLTTFNDAVFFHLRSEGLYGIQKFASTEIDYDASTASFWAQNNIANDSSVNGSLSMVYSFFRSEILEALIHDVSYMSPTTSRSVTTTFNFFSYNFDRGAEYTDSYGEVFVKTGMATRKRIYFTGDELHQGMNSYRAFTSQTYISNESIRTGDNINLPKYSIPEISSDIVHGPALKSFIIPKINSINDYWLISILDRTKIVINDLYQNDFNLTNHGYIQHS